MAQMTPLAQGQLGGQLLAGEFDQPGVFDTFRAIAEFAMDPYAMLGVPKPGPLLEDPQVKAMMEGLATNPAQTFGEMIGPGNLGGVFVGPRMLHGLGELFPMGRENLRLVNEAVNIAKDYGGKTHINTDPVAAAELDKIWHRQTQPWFEVPGDYLRYEIPDKNIGVNIHRFGKDQSYPDIGSITHDYPGLAEEMRVIGAFTPHLGKGVKGSYLPDLNAIAFPRGIEPSINTKAHELQHAVQQFEGWPQGSNPQALVNHPETLATYNRLQQSEVPNWTSLEDIAFTTYQRLMGEAEARAVGRRAQDFQKGAFNPYEEIHPLRYWDIPFDRLIKE